MDERMSRIAVTVEARVATIRMQAEEGPNAFTAAFVAELREALRVVDRPDVHAVVLCGLDEVFCSGASRALLRGLVAGTMAPTELTLARDVLAVPVPVIAAMRGHAVGGGLVLGLACDVVLLSRRHRYGFTFMDHGFTPGMGSTALCSHVWSPALVHELLYSTELRRGDTFAGSGVNAVLPPEDVEPHAFDLAARIAEKPRLALQTLKRVLTLPRRRAFEEATTTEALMHAVTLPGARV